MAKTTFYFKIEKNQEKSGSWLAVVNMKEPNEPNNGEIRRASAWSSAAPAKRWCASMINRKSIRWTVSEDKKTFTASVEIKV